MAMRKKQMTIELRSLFFLEMEVAAKLVRLAFGARTLFFVGFLH